MNNAKQFYIKKMNYRITDFIISANNTVQRYPRACVSTIIVATTRVRSRAYKIEQGNLQLSALRVILNLYVELADPHLLLLYLQNINIELTAEGNAVGLSQSEKVTLITRCNISYLKIGLAVSKFNLHKLTVGQKLFVIF